MTRYQITPWDRLVPRPEYAPGWPCVKHYHTSPDCLGALAGGWITVMDLCGPCTARLMVAVDWVTGRDNQWHHGYTERARDRVGGAS